jgi:YebC/PmpR family DNA-binding regulatory protein
MAGHSKWANIKRQKARVDSARGKIFTKVSREIIVAARSGGGDPVANFQLRTAIEKAKAAGIPNDNIERSIAKGSGTFGGSDTLEAIRYEGYGPGGVAVLIEALTDNRNRTAADLRAAFGKNGGNLGETGCVGWMFERKGIAVVYAPLDAKGRSTELDETALLEAALEADAESYELFEDEEAEATGAEVFTVPDNLEALSQALSAQGYRVTSEERWISSNQVSVTDPEQARLLLRLMDTLEDLDDVQSVTANFEMADDLMALSMGG